MAIEKTFGKMNEARERLGEMSAQRATLPPAQREALEHALRIGTVSTDDVAQAKETIKQTKAALGRFFESAGLDPQFRPFLAKVIGIDFIAQKDGGNPKKLVADLQQLAQAYGRLAEFPTASNIENTIAIYTGQKRAVPDELAALAKSGDLDKAKELGAQNAQRYGDRAEVFSAVNDLVRQVQRADFDTGIGGKMKFKRDDVFWSLRMGAAAVAVLQVATLLQAF